MITINGKKVDIGGFPDGTLLLKQEPPLLQRALIRWEYENDREFLALIYLVKHLRAGGTENIHLDMPYIPNARMDRVKNDEDVFTLKYFAELLNTLKLTSVTVLDPHSSVSEALIDNLTVRSPEAYINAVLRNINGEPRACITSDVNGDRCETIYPVTMFYPDEGAMKRYSGMISLPYTFGIKSRDFGTGKILGLDVVGETDKITGKNILIVDDICSRGGTFLHSAKKLKELGANKIYLYVTHCENTILEGTLLDSGLIEKVFTTDSIFTKRHEKIEVLK